MSLSVLLIPAFVHQADNPNIFTSVFILLRLWVHQYNSASVSPYHRMLKKNISECSFHLTSQQYFILLNPCFCADFPFLWTSMVYCTPSTCFLSPGYSFPVTFASSAASPQPLNVRALPHTLSGPFLYHFLLSSLTTFFLPSM